GEAEGTVLDPLKFGDVSFCRQGKGERAVGEKWKNESFVEVKFRSGAAVAETLQAAQGGAGNGCFLLYMYVKSEVFVDV
ncbi:hypothetical protein SMA49_26745, partial [Escherichia coli]|uniref:hypothetical protein n=1 Tax=Escherichia coli TaxID=562 RepID=UPI00307A2C6A